MSPASRRAPRRPATLWLRRSAEFEAVYAAGRKVQGAYVVWFYRPADGPAVRAGVTVSRKVGGAVVRNRVRRRLRECVRAHYANIPAGVEVVLVARARAAQAAYDELDQDLDRCRRRMARELTN